MEFKFTCGIYFFTQAFNDNVKKSDIGDSVSASAPVRTEPMSTGHRVPCYMILPGCPSGFLIQMPFHKHPVYIGICVPFS